ncbi:MAG: hypothetical protein LBG65_01500 [Puniceicoccales bacterium]|nr:hypothetical protein [Puniceicoccales bacterium]
MHAKTPSSPASPQKTRKAAHALAAQPAGCGRLLPLLASLVAGASLALPSTLDAQTYGGGRPPWQSSRFNDADSTGEGGGRRRGGFGGRFGRRSQPVERASYAPLALHGIMGNGPNTLVSITDVQTGESHWIALRDSSARWYVSEVNARKRTANVLLDGMPITISLITTASSGTPTPFRPAQPAAMVPATTTYLPNGNGAEDPPATPNAGFDAQAVAGEFAANIRLGRRPTAEQMTAFRERLATLTPEQRTEVFAQIRQLHQSAAGNAADANSANGTPAPAPAHPPMDSNHASGTSTAPGESKTAGNDASKSAAPAKTAQDNGKTGDGATSSNDVPDPAHAMP